MSTTTVLELAQRVFDDAKAIAISAGLPFAAVAGALGDLVIKEVGAVAMAGKIDGWAVAEAAAEAAEDVKFGPEKTGG
jgi:hypothetical protein